MVNTSDAQVAERSSGRTPTWVNWLLALLTIPAAGIALLVAMGAVMSTAGCSGAGCEGHSLGEFWFGVLMYGPAVISALTILVSFATASRRGGIKVPLLGLALIIIDVVVLVAAFAL